MELKKDPHIEKEMTTELFKRVFMMMVILRYDQFVRDENGVEVEPEEVEAVEKHGLLTIKIKKVDKEKKNNVKVKSI